MKTSDFEAWLYRGIQKYFGGWKNCVRELSLEISHPRGNNKASKWTDELVKEVLLKAHEEGKTSTDIYAEHRQMMNSLSHTYGGLKNTCEALGIPEFKKAPRGKDERRVKKNKEEVSAEIKRLHAEGKVMASNSLKNKGYRKLVDTATRVYRNWNSALKANDIEPIFEIKRHSNHSKQECLEYYLRNLDSDEIISQSEYYRSIQKHFGGALELMSYADELIKPEPARMNKCEIDNEVFSILERERTAGTVRITQDILDRYNHNLVYSIKQHYGSVQDYFSQLDIDFYSNPYVPFKWDAENTKRQLLRWIREGKSVNYTSVVYRHKGMITAARKFYGGWEGLFKACGLNYEEYKVDVSMASHYGKILEGIFAEILNELGVEYEREPEINECHPDFVLKGEDKRKWIDVKLSQWTVSLAQCETIPKYEPHCDELTIVFLRGKKNIKSKLIGDKTRLVNIYYYLNSLSLERKLFYMKELQEIETILKEQDATEKRSKRNAIEDVKRPTKKPAKEKVKEVNNDPIETGTPKYKKCGKCQGIVVIREFNNPRDVNCRKCNLKVLMNKDAS